MGNNKNYLSLLSIIASLAVVALHVNGIFWVYSTALYWLSAVLIESCCYFAVPVFLMISGANLLESKNESIRLFFIKRYKKTVLPFLVWSIIAGIFLSIVGVKMWPKDWKSIMSWISDILLTRFNGVYWYFPVLFSFYLTVPFFRSVPENKKKSVFGYLIILGFVLNNLVPFLFKLFAYFHIQIFEINTKFNLFEGMGYLIFPLIGYYIDHFEIKKKTRIYIYLSGAIGLFIDVSLTWFLSNKIGAVESTFKGYLHPTSIMYATSIFLLFKYVNLNRFEKIEKAIIDSFNKQTFGIYLIHWFLILFIEKKVVSNTASLKYRIIGTIVIFLLSWIITRILQKIPVVKKIVP